MSKIEVNTIDTQCGSTLTLGSSGKTITIPAGATISNAGTSSGFGGSGAVSWDTTPKTSTFTGATGIGYFVNTSGGAVTLNLPAGSAGNIIAVSDYARNFATANLTIAPNGSEKIGGVAEDAILNVNGQALTLIYVDGTNGWINVQNAEDTETGVPPFISATGGTITNTPTCRIHTFTSPGNFVVNSVATTPANNQVSYLVIAGGGAGGNGGCGDNGAGGGAGGFREDKSPVTPYTASPLEGAGAISVTASTFPIVVGAGGAVTPKQGGAGSVSTFSTITSAGGGGGAANATAPGFNSPANGQGGSGGGGRGGGAATPTPLIVGNTPTVSPAQGTPGGLGGAGSGGNPQSPDHGAGGGGGAGQPGQNTGNVVGGVGGNGSPTNISGSDVTRAGGGGGGAGPSMNAGGAGGSGGGGAGAKAGATTVAGTANTGGGGGGGNPGATPLQSAAGGSGIVIIRYKIA